jgi:hypothetical protein
VIWHRRYGIVFGYKQVGIQCLVTLVLRWSLLENVITVMPSVTCVDLLCWCYNHAADVVSLVTALAFITNMSEKHKSTSPSAVQVKNQCKTMVTEEKLAVVS